MFCSCRLPFSTFAFVGETFPGIDFALALSNLVSGQFSSFVEALADERAISHSQELRLLRELLA
jgi:hypothetical protein